MKGRGGGASRTLLSVCSQECLSGPAALAIPEEEEEEETALTLLQQMNPEIKPLSSDIKRSVFRHQGNGVQIHYIHTIIWKTSG